MRTAPTRRLGFNSTFNIRHSTFNIDSTAPKEKWRSQPLADHFCLLPSALCLLPHDSRATRGASVFTLHTSPFTLHSSAPRDDPPPCPPAPCPPQTPRGARSARCG